MPRKNPENKPLRIVRTPRFTGTGDDRVYNGLCEDEAVSPVVVEMMKCQAMLLRAGKDSAMPHFIACVKELERIHGFHFEQLDSDAE